MIEEKLEVNSRFFKVNMVQLENAVVAFMFEERMRMGTVAIAMPGTGEVAVGRSSVLVGGKYLMTTRALAERLAAKTGKIALVSLFTELDETEALRMYAKLLDKVPAVSQSGTRSPIDDLVRQNV
jgi:ribosomal protein L30E